MKRFAFLLVSGLLTIAAQGADTVVLKNGRRVDCTVTDFTDAAVKVRYDASERMVPLTDISHVEFAPLPGETEALQSAVREGDSAPLMGFYIRRLPWIGKPRNNAGELGLVYAELLAREPTPDRLARALTVYGQVEAGDWSAERQARAKAGRLRLMLRQGRADEVLPQAQELLEKSGDPRVMIDLRHILAEAAAGALAKLEEDHPRWEQEDDIVPERQRLYHETLDGYLFPHLFHGAEEDLAARGLWAAVQFCQAHGDPVLAGEWALDLTKLYPDSPEAGAARTLAEEAAARPRPAPQPAAEPDEAPGDAEAGEAPPEKPAKKKRTSKKKSPEPD